MRYCGVKLKQIATINAGYPFRDKISEVADSNVVAVQMKDVSLQEGIRWNKCCSHRGSNSLQNSSLSQKIVVVPIEI
jgi:hypothetical protein